MPSALPLIFSRNEIRERPTGHPIMDSSTITARPDVTVADTQPRVTPTPPRAARFSEVLSRTAVRGAETAMRNLPGSPLMAVALRGAAGPGPALGVPMTGTGVRAEGPAALGSGVGTTAAGLTTTGTEASNIEGSLAHSQEMNLYFLQIQEQVNAQNRSFTALSNVLKAQHDTVKTAIGNIR
jgi:hypothetical protein